MRSLYQNLPRISDEILSLLRGKKCLLAFSHGSDSTALFYALVAHGVSFDCAFVNYKTRAQSNDEERSARELCAKFSKEIFVKIFPLDLQHGSNFESVARRARYEFFGEICENFGYEILLTAHQLNDKFEWFLMQIAKGSGLVNAVSPNAVEARTHFTLVRPFLGVSKDEILKFLQSNNIKFFNDSSNENLKFKRNFIRENFGDAFIAEFGAGVKKSFEFMQSDKEALLGEFLYQNDELFVAEISAQTPNLIDKACKSLNHVLSQNERKECEKVLSNEVCGIVIAHKICVCRSSQLCIIAPYIKHEKMEKSFKEKCRTLKIPPLARGYFCAHNAEISAFEALLSRF